MNTVELFENIEYVLSFGLNALPANEEQINGLLKLTNALRETPEHLIQISLHSCDDPAELAIARQKTGYKMVLTLSDSSHENQRLLVGNRLSFDQVRRVLYGILEKGLATDQIPVIVKHFRGFSQTHEEGELSEQNDTGMSGDETADNQVCCMFHDPVPGHAVDHSDLKFLVDDGPGKKQSSILRCRKCGAYVEQYHEECVTYGGWDNPQNDDYYYPIYDPTGGTGELNSYPEAVHHIAGVRYLHTRYWEDDWEKSRSWSYE